jgi:hypothetical protein
MSDDKKSHRRKADGCEVGYGKPPKVHQFKPGQSGNPDGRPKGSTKIVTMIERVLKQKIAVTVGGQEKRMSLIEALLNVAGKEGLKGDLKAIATVFSAARQAGLLEPESKENEFQGGIMIAPAKLSPQEWLVSVKDHDEKAAERHRRRQKEKEKEMSSLNRREFYEAAAGGCPSPILMDILESRSRPAAVRLGDGAAGRSAVEHSETPAGLGSTPRSRSRP